MTRLSRREFLKRSGALAGTASIGFGSAGPAPSGNLAGRAFTVTDVHVRPDSSSPALRQLAPDSVVPISGISRDNHWYQIDDSFVAREALQLILPYNRPVVVDAVGGGFWAELVAPISPVREWCAGSAPILARPGFGAVVYVMDRMVDDHGQVWYAVSDSPGSPLAGWASALHYAPWLPAPKIGVSSLRIAIHDAGFGVFDGERLLGQAAIYGPRLPRIDTTLRAVQPGALLGSRFGVPWLMELATGQRLYGAYWHNRFGLIGDGLDVELSTFAARWLYGLVANQPAAVVVA